VFKVGDRIVLTEKSRRHCHIFHEHPGDIATVIEVSQLLSRSGYECVLEFDRNIGGHDGSIDARGKNGHCVIYHFCSTQWDKYFRKTQSKRKNNYY
jgi:hypothetical protein